MIRKIKLFSRPVSWQTKLILSSSTAIFLTFTLFSLLEYKSISKWMMNREEQVVKRTLADISTYYKDRNGKLSVEDISKSSGFLRTMNDNNQMIRIYDNKGNVLASDKDGVSPILEPAPVAVSSIELITTAENEAIVGRIPLKVTKFQGTIEIVRELSSYNKMMERLFVVMTSFGVLAILFSALSGFFLSRQLLRPVRNLAMAMKKIKENGFQERMELVQHKDELTDLSHLFNDMMDQIEQSFLQQKQFIEDASHELRTPVSILEGHLSLLNRWGKKDPAILDESLEASLEEVSKLKKLVVDLLELTRAENLRPSFFIEYVDVKTFLQRLVKNLEMLHPEFQFTLRIEEAINPVFISEQHLQQILIIILDNAIKYSETSRKIDLTVEQTVKETSISVIDYGIGIPEEHITDVFNRFYRIDKARNREKGGTGLGLSIAKRLIEKYNGCIYITSQEEKGTKVKMVIPSYNYGKF